MKEFIKTIKNIWSVEELKKRIIYTLLLILVYRIGSYVILPGINSDALVSNSSNDGGILGLINIFAGGAFGRVSVMSLGIMPYISASIVMQLLGLAVPAVQKMQREGESGRKKINRLTRYLTIVICVFQGISYLNMYAKPSVYAEFVDSPLWWVQSVVILTAGTMFVTWLGERITDRGVGNGVSLIIAIGILANLPMALLGEFGLKASNGGMVLLLVELVALYFVIILTVLLVQGTRRIPVHSAKRIVNQRGGRQAVSAAKRSFIPLKINQAGVMPIIFAQALMFLPAFIWRGFNDVAGFWYNLVFFILIVMFTYFYTAITMNPNQMADELKRSGAFIPGVKPGKNTAEFIDSLLSRLILPGSVFLGIIAILPAFAMNADINQGFAYFYGGTSLLIMVGVVLDTLQQVESYLLNSEYDGLMKGGRMRGRNVPNAPVSMPQTI
ncbi:preprotein translocase subunit SecY [Parvicella tangerina]|uniref:Protein translocase subunit SecY n=1 Tax=Parvicella tangerina TaxID=2829795 RepID=A0A916JKT7_9FLAO|nr:preprotein translocase subunit SecY [Parvicella tangerina]CAG5079008.1 Protein translocase subunit SecY [Parvicella tangerina]